MRKKMLLCMLCMGLMFLCCSCDFNSVNRYSWYIDGVESIQIIQLDKYIEEEDRYEYTILTQIPDHRIFINQFNEMSQSKISGVPQKLDIQQLSIRVNYKTGNFHILQPNAQLYNMSGVNEYGHYVFDKEQFNALISDYWAG